MKYRSQQPTIEATNENNCYRLNRVANRTRTTSQMGEKLNLGDTCDFGLRKH